MAGAEDLLKRLHGGSPPQARASQASRADQLLEALHGPSTAPEPQAPTGPPVLAGRPQSLGGALTALPKVGIPDFQLRYALSRADTPQERAKVLDEFVGPGNWLRDEWLGKYMLQPEAAEWFGVKSKYPVPIEDLGLTRYDIADIGGSLPGVVGGALGGTISGAPFGPAGAFTGFLRGVGGAFLGGTAGKAGQEAYEAAAGENIQPAHEVGADILREGTEAALGEIAFGVGPRALGRKVLAPRAAYLKPEDAALVERSLAIGARPPAGAVTRAPILGRLQSLMDHLGDPRIERNSRALEIAMGKLRQPYGKATPGRSEVGGAVQKDIRDAREALRTWADSAYEPIKQAALDRPIIPTTTLKAEAKRQLKLLAGLAPDDLTKRLQYLASRPDIITLEEAQLLRKRLFDARGDDQILPTLDDHYIGKLDEALDQGFRSPIVGDDKYDQALASSLTNINEEYSRRIDQFKDAFVSRLGRDPKFRGGVEPEKIFDMIWEPNNPSRISKALLHLTNDTRRNVRHLAMEDILASAVKDIEGGEVDTVFNGLALQKKLAKMGDETLIAMFGPAKVRELHDLADVMSFSMRRMKAGSGAIAMNQYSLHPVRKFPFIVKLRLMAHFLETNLGFRWFTEGLKMPKTRAGAAAASRFVTQLAAMADQYTADADQPAKARPRYRDTTPAPEAAYP